MCTAVYKYPHMFRQSAVGCSWSKLCSILSNNNSLTMSKWVQCAGLHRSTVAWQKGRGLVHIRQNTRNTNLLTTVSQQNWQIRGWENDQDGQKNKQTKILCGCMRDIEHVLPPPCLVWMVGLIDNGLFYFGDAWLQAHAGARQAVTGPIFLVLNMFMCRSDVDAKSKRQTMYLGGGLKPGLPATVFEHKWATLNSSSHMAVDVTAVTIVSVPPKSFQIQHLMQMWLSYHNTMPEKHNMDARSLQIQKEAFILCLFPSRLSG